MLIGTHRLQYNDNFPHLDVTSRDLTLENEPLSLGPGQLPELPLGKSDTAKGCAEWLVSLRAFKAAPKQLFLIT